MTNIVSQLRREEYTWSYFLLAMCGFYFWGQHQSIKLGLNHFHLSNVEFYLNMYLRRKVNSRVNEDRHNVFSDNRDLKHSLVTITYHVNNGLTSFNLQFQKYIAHSLLPTNTCKMIHLG